MKAFFDETKNTKYVVTDEGEVFAMTKKKGVCDVYPKKCTVHSRGYVYVRTTSGNYQLHRVVASAFLPNPENKPCINHKDGNKQNNDVSNLEWVTYRENYQHAIDNGLIKQPKKNEGRLKYSNEQCKDVLNRVENGMDYKKAGEKYKMPYSTVAHLVRGSRRLIL